MFDTSDAFLIRYFIVYDYFNVIISFFLNQNKENDAFTLRTIDTNMNVVKKVRSKFGTENVLVFSGFQLGTAGLFFLVRGGGLKL